MPAQTQAGRIASISVPETIQPLEPGEQFPPLLDPAPVNSSWAAKGFHPLGVCLDNYELTQQQVSAAQGTGCGLVRLRIPMEHFIDENTANWAVLDQVVSRLERAGFEILPVLDADAAIPEFYRQFCSAVARRYGKTFKYYQLLDNINYKIGLDTRAYADLVSASRTAIVLSDDDAVIVSGGIRGVDLTYLEMLNNQGAMRGLDVLAFNLYPPPVPIESTDSAVRREHCLPFMADAMDWARAHDKRVWVTSYGVSTSYNWVGVNQPCQAAMYARGALYLGWLGVERIVFAAIQDSDAQYQDPSRCCGLLDVSGTAKASYFALQALNNIVAGAYNVSPPFLYQGYTYETPEAADMVISPSLSGLPGADALAEFQVHNLPVYAFWFYAPARQEYRMVYWLGLPGRYRVLMTLNVGHIGLTPIDRFLLLDNAPSPVNYQFAQNFLYLPYLPIDELPGVVRFEVNENGRPR